MNAQLERLEKMIAINAQLIEVLKEMMITYEEFARRKGLELPKRLTFLKHETVRILDDLSGDNSINTDAPSTPNAPKCGNWTVVRLVLKSLKSGASSVDG